MIVLACAVAMLAPAIRLEAETARLEGPQIASSRAGFSGMGYVTDITSPGARLSWKLRAKAGIYELRIGYAAAQEKGYEVGVNGSRSSGMLPATGERFGVKAAGRVELRDGENEISVERGWGYYDVDYVELSPAPTPPRLRSIKPHLSDPKATPETRRLYSDLLGVYGQKTLSGQYDEAESDFVRTTTGQTPAILGGDFMDYSPSRQPYFDKPLKDAVPSWIDRVRKGQILTLSWHWNAPKDLIDVKELKKPNGQVIDASWYRGFYTDATTFDVQKALADPSSEDYRLILRDIDAIAEQLKRLQAAKVPVLWRPLHEADGRWFWWGAKGAEPCKALWRLMHRRMTQHHDLHNLIWVWNSPKPEWYPGDDTVDVMSVDLYPGDRRDAMSGVWEEQLARFDGRKPLGLAEFPGAPDVERMRRFGVRWLYFISWTGGVGPRATVPEVLKGTYRSKFVKNAKAP